MPDFENLIFRARGHQADGRVLADHAVHNAHENDNAAVGVVLAVEDERLEGRCGVALRGGDVLYDILRHGLDVDAVFRGDLRRVHRRDTDDILDLGFGALRVGGGQVDLIDDGQDFQIVFQREICVCKRLRLHTLRGVHDEHRALARGERAGDLVVEVHMARRVDEIERVGFAVFGLIGQADGARLDGDAALALKIHIVKDLLGHFALLHRAAQLDEPVGQRGFAVVNVRDDGEIPDMALVDHRGGTPQKKNQCVLSSCAARARSSSASACSRGAGSPSGSSVRPSR